MEAQEHKKLDDEDTTSLSQDPAGQGECSREVLVINNMESGNKPFGAG